jgi:hypothetical protein
VDALEDAVLVDALEDAVLVDAAFWDLAGHQEYMSSISKIIVIAQPA